jgi:hypothetical protein
LAATEQRLNSDVDMLRQRNQELEQLLKDAQAAAATPAKVVKPAVANTPDKPAIPQSLLAFPAAPSHAPKLRKVSCVVHVGGLDREELENEANPAVRFCCTGLMISHLFVLSKNTAGVV